MPPGGARDASESKKMKLMRIGAQGAERPCILDATGQARDVSSVIEDFGPHTLDGIEDTLRDVDPTTLPVIDPIAGRIGAPMSLPLNIYCIGLNYSDHAAEAGLPVPDDQSCLTSPPPRSAAPMIQFCTHRK